MTNCSVAMKTLAIVSFLLVFVGGWSRSAAAVVTHDVSNAESSDKVDLADQRQQGDEDGHKMAVRALSISHKYVGLGRRSPIDEVALDSDDDDAGAKRGLLPSSLRFTGLGKKRRQGVSAAMRYAGLGKRFPEQPEMEFSDADESTTTDDDDARPVVRRRRYAIDVIDGDEVRGIYDVDGDNSDEEAEPTLYGVKRQSAASGKPRIGVGMRYVGVGKRKQFNVRSRVDAGMRYMGIGKRGDW